MTGMDLLETAKMANRMTTNAFDFEVIRILDAGLMDLGVAGVQIPEQYDALVTQAVITYFLMNFGQPDQYDRLKRSYDEQKAQLSTCTGYTTWTEAQ